MRPLLLTLAMIFLPLAGAAQSPRDADAVLDTLQIAPLLEIMEQEAVEAGADLAESLLQGSGGESWTRTIAQINDAERLETRLRTQFDAALPEDQAAPILEFFDSDAGQRIVALEISARRALLDPDIEMQNLAAMADASDGTRMPLLDRFVEANQLIDRNVAGALMANAAFLEGLQAGAERRSQPPAGRDDIAAQVAEQEPDIRATTTEWVYGFLYLAYRPLTDAELDRYIAFSQTEAGAALNDALFDAFDRIFIETSRETGAALARYLASQDI